MPILAIVADDLTGAADTGAPFAAAGLSTLVPLASGTRPPATDVLVLSTESRDLDAAGATRAVAAVVSTLFSGTAGDSPRWLYKKIDSVLRGHPRDELLAALAASGMTAALVAPAFPSEGRTTIGGHQRIDGVPLASSRFDDFGREGDLRALFANDQGLPVRLLDLETIRAGPAALRRRLDQAEGITIADAETDEDLLTLARTAPRSRRRVLCGSAGLARQLAPLLSPATAAPAVSIAPRSGPVLVVAGSQHAATARQLRMLSEAGIPVVRPAQETIDDPHSPIAGIVAEVAARLAAGQTTALTTSGLAPCPHGGHVVAARLAEIAIVPAVRDQLGGLVLTGGDVAAAVCAALGAAALRLGGEIAPGLPWGILEGGALPDLPIATKAGSFGDDDALLRCAERLEDSLSSPTRRPAHGARGAIPCQPAHRERGSGGEG